MSRHVSGTFERTDRVLAIEGSTVRLLGVDKTECRATLLELSLSDVLLSGVQAPELGSNVSVAITLSGRYIEFELPGVVTWHHRQDFGVSFEYLTARQTYGLSLAISVLGRPARAKAAAQLTRAARR
ncbi:MAG TPA: PilZ domain-containing protein [Polyangiaceae bacterium]|jgi:hypothetical protein